MGGAEDRPVFAAAAHSAVGVGVAQQPEATCKQRIVAGLEIQSKIIN